MADNTSGGISNEDRQSFIGVFKDPGYFKADPTARRQKLSSLPMFQRMPAAQRDVVLNGLMKPKYQDMIQQRVSAMQPEAPAAPSAPPESPIAKGWRAATTPISQQIAGPGATIQAKTHQYNEAHPLTGAMKDRPWAQNFRKVLDTASEEGAGVLDAMQTPLGIATAGMGGLTEAKSVIGRAVSMLDKGSRLYFSGAQLYGARKALSEAIDKPNAENITKLASAFGIAYAAGRGIKEGKAAKGPSRAVEPTSESLNQVHLPEEALAKAKEYKVSPDTFLKGRIMPLSELHAKTYESAQKFREVRDLRRYNEQAGSAISRHEDSLSELRTNRDKAELDLDTEGVKAIDKELQTKEAALNGIKAKVSANHSRLETLDEEGVEAHHSFYQDTLRQRTAPPKSPRPPKPAAPPPTPPPARLSAGPPTQGALPPGKPQGAPVPHEVMSNGPPIKMPGDQARQIAAAPPSAPPPTPKRTPSQIAAAPPRQIEAAPPASPAPPPAVPPKVSTPTPAEAPAPVATTQNAPSNEVEKQETGVFKDDGKVKIHHRSELTINPNQFQFKSKAIGKGGTTDALRDVDKVDPDMLGILHVWKDPKNGKVNVVNGHHRMERVNSTEYDGPIATRYLDAKNAKEARTKGALINIAEGRGESVDAAKIFREGGLKPEDLKKFGISRSSNLVKQGLSLSKLSDPVFQDVSTGKLTEGRGAIIGDLLDKPADQEAAAQMARDLDKKGKNLSDGEFREALGFIKGAPRDVQETQDLFGTNSVEKNLFIEKGEVSDFIKGQLATDKRLLGMVSKEKVANRLNEVGNTINIGSNSSRATEAAQVLEVYEKSKRMSGPVADVLDQAAKELAEGAKPGDVKQRAYQRINEHLGRELSQIHAGREGSNSNGISGNVARGVDPPKARTAGKPGRRGVSDVPPKAKQTTTGQEAETAAFNDQRNASLDKARSQAELNSPLGVGDFGRVIEMASPLFRGVPEETGPPQAGMFDPPE